MINLRVIKTGVFYLCLSLGILPSIVFAQGKGFIYLSPAEIEGLPVQIVEVLKAEKCLVPKWIFMFKGVARGEFAESGQQDVAVLCQYADIAEIRIFWGGPKKCNSRISSLGQFIGTANEKHILKHYSGTLPHKFKHQAIVDHTREKSSIVKYCHLGEWLEFSGKN